MGTRSITTIYNEDNKPILAFYRQYDGYYDGHGKELQAFLSDIAIVNGYGSGTPAKAANQMSCLAAQLIAHFKEGIGNIYIAAIGDTEEYNYEIRYIAPKSGSRNGRVSLVGKCSYEPDKKFVLYSDDINLGPVILRRVEFCYDKRDGEGAKWRTVDVTDESGGYISGFEEGKYKRFLVSRIVGGKIIPV